LRRGAAASFIASSRIIGSRSNHETTRRATIPLAR
jgi:hypothetical protein